MKIRFFGSHECDLCNLVRKRLLDENFRFDFVDALDFDDENADKLCDENSVDALPHVQIIDDNGVKIREFVGSFEPEDLIKYLRRKSG